MSAPSNKRVSRKDWYVAGLSLLRENGYQMLTIERLCARLEKTKGSFYHHFDSFDVYLEALLSQWEADLTESPIAAASKEPSTARKTARLDDVVVRLDHRLDRAVRAWALHDERARTAMRRVDERRIAYLTDLHRAIGRKNPRLLAELEYAAFVGSQHLDLFDDLPHATKLGVGLRAALAFLGGETERKPAKHRR